MENLLSDPLIQSAAVPFFVSLIVAVILRPHGWYWAGMAALAGFAATAYLVVGFEFFPLRADRKILLTGAGAALLGVLLDLIPWRRFVPLLLFAGAAATAVWLLWPRLSPDEEWLFLATAAGGVLYVGWLVAASEGVKEMPLQADSMVFALGLGTGISALLGATALYGQLGSAIAAAVGARLLLQMLGKTVNAGAVMVVPLTAVLGLLGVGAVIYSKLPWYTLVVLALVPLLARLPLPKRWPPFARLLLSVLATGSAAAGAIYLTWLETGAPPI